MMRSKRILALHIHILLLSILLIESQAWSSSAEIQVDSCFFRRIHSLDKGTSHLFVRNRSNVPVVITQVLLDDEPLPPHEVLHWNVGEGSLNGLTMPLLIEQDDFRVLWYQVTPNPLPPGKVADIAVKWTFAPSRMIKLAARTSNGLSVSGRHQPVDNPLKIGAIRFSPDLRRCYTYLRNSGSRIITPQRIWFDTEDVTAVAYPPWPWPAVGPGETFCLLFPIEQRVRRGEYVSVKVQARKDETTQGIVRVYAEFPIAGHRGRPIHDMGLDRDVEIVSHDYLNRYAGAQEKRFVQLLDCPTHEHGSYGQAARRIVSRMADSRMVAADVPAFCHICKAVQEEGLCMFGEICDFLSTTPYESLRRSSSDVLAYPTQMICQLAKDAAAPKPWMAMIRTGTDPRFREYRDRPLSAVEIRLFVYCALSRGAKGLTYYEEPKDVWTKEELRLLNEEIRAASPYLLIGEPVGLGGCSHSLVEVCTLQAGYEGMLILLINRDYQLNDESGIEYYEFSYSPQKDINVTVHLPEFFGEVESLSLITQKQHFEPVHFQQKDRSVSFQVPNLGLAQIYIVKASSPY